MILLDGRPQKSPFEAMSPSPSYLTWVAVRTQFLITFRILMRYGAFCLVPLRAELQNVKLLSRSLELVPQ